MDNLRRQNILVLPRIARLKRQEVLYRRRQINGVLIPLNESIAEGGTSASK